MGHSQSTYGNADNFQSQYNVNQPAVTQYSSGASQENNLSQYGSVHLQDTYSAQQTEARGTDHFSQNGGALSDYSANSNHAVTAGPPELSLGQYGAVDSQSQYGLVDDSQSQYHAQSQYGEVDSSQSQYAVSQQAVSGYSVGAGQANGFSQYGSTQSNDGYSVQQPIADHYSGTNPFSPNGEAASGYSANSNYAVNVEPSSNKWTPVTTPASLRSGHKHNYILLACLPS